MKKNIDIKNLAEFILIFLFGVYVRYLIVTGGIAFYVNPRYFNLIDAAGIVAVFVGLLGVIYELSKVNPSGHKGHPKMHSVHLSAAKKESSDSHTRQHNMLSQGGIKGGVSKEKAKRTGFFVFSNILIISTLIVGFTIEPKHLSTRAASNRSSQSQAAFKDNSDNVINSFIKSYDDYDIADWLKSFNREPDLNLYNDIDVHVRGFIFKSNEQDENEFILGRFVIRCCVVDASPVGLIVKLDNWKATYKEGEWLEVKGTFRVIDSESSKKIYIEPVDIKKIDTPNNPYIY